MVGLAFRAVVEGAEVQAERLTSAMAAVEVEVQLEGLHHRNCPAWAVVAVETWP